MARGTRGDKLENSRREHWIKNTTKISRRGEVGIVSSVKSHGKVKE